MIEYEILEKERKPILSIKNNIEDYDCVADAINFAYGLSETHNERIFFIGYDDYDKIIGIGLISFGTTKETKVYNRNIIEYIVLMNVSSFSILHNHPNGSLDPSEEDLDIINDMKMIANMLDVKFKESFIISFEGWYGITSNEKSLYIGE